MVGRASGSKTVYYRIGNYKIVVVVVVGFFFTQLYGENKYTLDNALQT